VDKKALTTDYNPTGGWPATFVYNLLGMKNTTTVLLFGLFMLAGCTTTGRYLFVKTSVACPPLSDTSMFVLLPKKT
jgi:hypothetical protein